MLTGQFEKFKGADYPSPTGRDKAKKIRSDLQAHISTPPTTTTTDKGQRRYTNIPLGTKYRSGHAVWEIPEEML